MKRPDTTTISADDLLAFIDLEAERMAKRSPVNDIDTDSRIYKAGIMRHYIERLIEERDACRQ